MKAPYIETPEDTEKYKKSHRLAVLMVRDAELRGVILADIVSHCLSKLKISKLERIQRLLHRILQSKYETRKRYAENNLFEFEIRSTN